MNKEIVLVLTLISLFTGLLPASPPEKSSNETVLHNFTWQDVLSEAKRKNPTLKKAEESIKQAQLNYYKSWTNFLPQVSASAGASESKSTLSNSPTSINDGRSYSYGISGNLSIFSGFSDSAELKMKNIDLKIAEMKYKRIVSNMVYNLKKSFIELLWAQEMVNLTEKILRRREENYQLLQFKYEAGREDKGSLLRIEADKLQAEYELAKARRNIKTASAQLAKEIGIDNFDVIVVTGSFIVTKPITPAEIMSVNELVKQTPEYLIAEYELKKSLYEVRTARSEFYPKVSLSGSISRSGEELPPKNDRWTAGLNLSYPFFPGGRNIYNLKIAKTNRTIAEETLNETRQQLTAKLESALNNYIDAVENVAVREKYLNAAEVQSKIITTKYINGLVSYQEWYVVEGDFINAHKSLLNAKKDAAIYEAYWKNVLGQE